MLTTAAFLSIAPLPCQPQSWGAPLGFQACRRPWLREPVWPEQEAHLRLGAVQPETLATRLHRPAAVFVRSFYDRRDTSASHLTTPPVLLFSRRRSSF